MGSTILTVIVLVVMWVVVLVPMFTRRNEEAAETAGGRLGGAVRILARRDKPAPHVSHADEDPENAVVEDSMSEDEEVVEESEVDIPAVAARPMPSTRAQMLARRRRTLGTIVMLAIMTALLAAGWRPRIWIVQGALDVLLVGYLWWLRQEVHRERARRARRAQRRESVARTESRPGLSRPATPRPAEPVEDVVEDAVAAPVDDGRWEPRPVPTPTYVNAAIHQRRPGERRHETVELDDQDPELYAEFEDDYPTMEIIAPPRAVNE